MAETLVNIVVDNVITYIHSWKFYYTRRVTSLDCSENYFELENNVDLDVYEYHEFQPLDLNSRTGCIVCGPMKIN
jgi:hypothetical protein